MQLVIFKFDPRRSFFDRKKVQKALTDDARKALSRIGAFIMRRARGSIRTNQRSARPDRPPRSHLGTLKKQIFFAYDPRRLAVVVGPVLRVTSPAVKPIGKTIPELLERGGEAVVTADGYSFPARGRKSQKTKSQVVRLARGTRLRYSAHPYMEPALRKETTNPKLREAWAFIS